MEYGLVVVRWGFGANARGVTELRYVGTCSFDVEGGNRCYCGAGAAGSDFVEGAVEGCDLRG